MTHAVVVGGGIGGLGSALALCRAGWRVTVLERAPAFAGIGAGLSLWANALSALDALGLGDRVRSTGQAGGGSTRTAAGRVLSHVDDARARVLGVHRADLHRILLEPLPADCLVTDAEVIDVEASGRVVFRRKGETVTINGDLVVGADGINSAVRSRLWGDTAGPVFSGTTAWRAVTAWHRPLPAGVSLGPGAEFGMIRVGGGRVYWYGVVSAPAMPQGAAPREPADEWASVRERFGAWHDPIPALLAATPPEAVLRHDIYHLATPLPSYVEGRVVLVGDAAHAMTPFLGQGACQALEDAVVLGRLAGDLAEYDRQRRPRTQQVARASLRTGRLGQQLTNPVAVAVRKHSAAALPASVVARATDAVTGWRAPGQGR
jgi:2-polyprenyl-6-methoxyphenol hydroxylase-like FAD-dependent oxidoreductase